MRLRAVGLALAAAVVVLIPAAAQAASGGRDPSFNGTGIVDVWGVPTNFFISVARASVVQPDGKIVVVGSALDPATSVSDFGIVRLNPDGSLDTSFGSGGRVLVSLSGNTDQAWAVKLLPNGSLLVAGAVNQDTESGVVKLTGSGQLDPTFGSGGKALIPSASYGSTNGAVATKGGAGFAMSQGRPVLLVTDSQGHQALVRLTPTGAIDTSFNGTGYAPVGRTPSDPGAWSTVIAGQGGTVIVGGIGLPTAPVLKGNHIELGRFTSSGQPDGSFGTGGYTVLYIGNEQPGQTGVGYLGDLALAPDGSILVWGVDTGCAPGTGPCTGVGPVLAHVSSGGGVVGQTIIPGYTTYGAMPSPTAMALGADGSVYGLWRRGDQSTGQSLSELVRFTPSLAFDTQFGSGGVASANFGTNLPPAGGDQAEGITVDPQGRLLITGIHHDPSPSRARGAIMRILTGGGAGIPAPVLTILGNPRKIVVSGSSLPFDIMSSQAVLATISVYTVSGFPTPSADIAAHKKHHRLARVKVGQKSVNIAAARPTVIGVRLSARAQQLLAKYHHLKVKVTVKLKNATGKTTTKSFVITIKRAPKPHKHH